MSPSGPGRADQRFVIGPVDGLASAGELAGAFTLGRVRWT
jgi:hypothetical protein